jgi:hypothetical protein
VCSREGNEAFEPLLRAYADRFASVDRREARIGCREGPARAGNADFKFPRGVAVERKQREQRRTGPHELLVVSR